MAVEIPEKKLIPLSSGDVPALEIQHIGNRTVLRVQDAKGEVLVQAQLTIGEAFDLSCALENEHYGLLSDDDDDPPPRIPLVTGPS